MKKTLKKALCLGLAAVMTFSLAACNGNGATDTQKPGTEKPSTEGNVSEEVKSILGKEYGVDYTALYEQFGKDITIADVTEDQETGFAYITVDGKQYELGLDFLSMAMVYNTTVPEGGTWKTADDVYATWWKLYIQRWNYLLPEIPLYSNEYYDIYNTQIGGVKEHPTNPYWGPASAVIDWTSSKADNSIILGNSTDLSGKFYYATFAGSNPGAADLDIQGLVVGLETVSTTKDGGFQWNDTVVKSHKETENEDGSKTFEIEIYDDLKLSDGSKVTAKNYLAFVMAFSSPVAEQAAGKNHQAGMSIVGYDAFSAYDGATGTKEFTGLRLLGDYKFSVTISPDYLPYFYDISYAGFSAYDVDAWLGKADIKDDGNGCYFTDDFYAKDAEGKYTVADHIKNTAVKNDGSVAYSGPYVVASYDEQTKEAVLTKNPNFKGNYEGTKPSIEKIIYVKVVSETQMVAFQNGAVDVIAGITGGTETDEAISIADKSNGKYAYIHYSRAGYGKLGFRADYGPAQFVEVRQAIAFCMDRAKFAKDFTGGYGGVTDGPYYTGSWMYQAAKEQGMLLNAYATSVDEAIATLEKGGWVYDKDGNEYTSGVRYKKIPADQLSENDKIYKSKDGAYVTTKVGDYYYMPLVLNWYGTSDNPFTDQLITGLMEDANIKAAGFVIQNQIGDFAPMLDELYQADVYGYYSGTPMYSVFNFATGFNSAAYDYSYNLTIDPSMYDDYSAYYIKDMADVYWLK